MNRSIRAAAIGLFGGAMAIAVATGSASALNGPPQGHPGDQSATQGNGIGQVAGAAAQSKQILPTNLNVAPSILSVGSNDGWVTQGNASSANANAQNENQSFQGNGAVQKGGSAPDGASQSAAQGNGIGQVAGAAAQSKQILPTNLNVAPSILSVGSNDGWVTQGNASSANANAQNDNRSFQGNGTVQQGGSRPSPWEGSGPPVYTSGKTGWSSGYSGQPQGGKNCHPRRPESPKGENPGGPDQSATQGNGIGQVAGAAAKSTQVAPTNVNVAPSILSVGSNDGGVTQGNASSANANAQNENQSFQVNGAGQQGGGNPGPQGNPDPQGIPGPQGNPGPTQPSQSATQGNGIGQVAGAAAKSTQVAPTNVNVAPSILSVGSNDGGVTQGNASSANANAQNSSSSGQGNILGQGTGGPSGLLD